MLTENRLIVERCIIAEGASRTKKSGFKGDFAVASMISRGIKNCCLGGILMFSSLNLNGVFSPATSATLAMLEEGEEGGEGGRTGPSLPV